MLLYARYTGSVCDELSAIFPILTRLNYPDSLFLISQDLITVSRVGLYKSSQPTPCCKVNIVTIADISSRHNALHGLNAFSKQANATRKKHNRLF